MATTSIWSIKNNLMQSINYIINPEKTINKDYGKNSYNYLEISTTEYNFKNEKVCYVSSLNCSEDNPYEDMKFTKERFGKTDGILAFHGYQSFKENEVTPILLMKLELSLQKKCLVIMKWLFLHTKIQIIYTITSY